MKDRNKEIRARVGKWPDAWGGFNVVQFPNERRCCQSSSFAMHNLSDFSNEHKLLDMSLEGGSFTWSNKDAGSMKKILF